MVLQRAKYRKLEEMKRFELQQQLEATKAKRFDGENNDNKVKLYLYILIYIKIKKHFNFYYFKSMTIFYKKELF